MRYGKVYFYDRMGNREPSEAEKIREALDNFDAPRFRPPDEPRMSKRYNFSPLDSPPPILGGSDSGDPIQMGVNVAKALEDAEMSLPPRLANFRQDDLDLALPPNLAGDLDNTTLPNIDRYRMDLPHEVYPDDPVPRIVPSPTMGMKFNLGESMGPSIERGIMAGHGTGVDRERMMVGSGGGGEDPMDQVTRNLGHIRFQTDEEKLRSNHLMSDDYYGSDDICAQCRCEDDYMDRMREKAEEERRKYEDSMKRARIYDADMKEKEEVFKQEEVARNKALREHVDRINAEIIDAKKRRPKSPVQENYIFRHESPRIRDSEIQKQKDAYRADLDRQIEEKRLRRIAEVEKNEAIDVTSNARAALEFANAREAERKAKDHAKQLARKQLEFQMEMQRIGAPSDKNWLWWAERPDEHGWRDARMANLKHTNQIERNQTIKHSIGQLENFKAQQVHDDMVVRDLRRSKYEKIRDQLHQNSKMLYPLSEGDSDAHRKHKYMQNTDPRVEAAWRDAHEKYDKKFRVLQENPMKSISGAALGASSSTHVSCRRCARCSRPLERKVGVSSQHHRGETIILPTSEWHRS